MTITKKVISKVILAGDGAVGKTTLLNAFLGKTEEEVKITVGLNVQSASYEVGEGREIKTIMVFWDFAGQPQFRFFQKDFAKSPAMVIFVFDLTRYKTLINIEKEWLPMFDEGTSKFAKVLVGNKCDLKQVVPENEIEKICKKYGMRYFKVSAVKNENVDELYNYIRDTVLDMIRS